MLMGGGISPSRGSRISTHISSMPCGCFESGEYKLRHSTGGHEERSRFQRSENTRSSRSMVVEPIKSSDHCHSFSQCQVRSMRTKCALKEGRGTQSESMLG